MSSTTQGDRQEELVVKGSKCEDCGNQAKKDCAYSRCRTCCKNKGFHCQTHIRSTWIPVDKRRQRLEQPLHHFQAQGGGDVPKRHKQQNNPYSSLEEFKFPAVVNSMAVFSCVRVRSMDETVNEIAYQTSVNIGGHVFSGLLYDQGPQQDQQTFNAKGESSSIEPINHQQHNNDLNLIGASSAITMAPPLSTTHELLFPPPHPLASFRPGMPYFSLPKP
ncbi:Zinc finger, lateral root primordium type 1 [Sesbania bispinosa]|nr:Zinc finger, lateral root primordium type 1 [Sesbania bispinosa]